jgi:hypothetical protein
METFAYFFDHPDENPPWRPWIDNFIRKHLQKKCKVAAAARVVPEGWGRELSHCAFGADAAMRRNGLSPGHCVV